jgi:hypothetical protein
MTLVIGTDEAGYGPNLGPLVIGATAWQVDAPAATAERVLGTAVGDALTSLDDASPRVVWRDSKEVYRGGAGRTLLLRSALAGIAIAHGGVPQSWPALLAVLGRIGPTTADTSPEWQTFSDNPLLDASLAAEIHEDATHLTRSLAERGVRLCRVACTCLYPGTFNALIDRGMNKSDILSRETLALAAQLAEDLSDPHATTLIWCDRHGGRKRYAGVIAAAFEAQAVPIQETPTHSAYRLGSDGLFGSRSGGDTVLEFSVRGEQRPPVAVASLTAKCVRELTMETFNRFWSQEDANLEPTAGYPVDAARWRQQASPTITRLGLDSHQIWRQV